MRGFQIFKKFIDNYWNNIHWWHSLFFVILIFSIGLSVFSWIYRKRDSSMTIDYQYYRAYKIRDYLKELLPDNVNINIEDMQFKFNARHHVSESSKILNGSSKGHRHGIYFYLAKNNDMIGVKWYAKSEDNITIEEILFYSANDDVPMVVYTCK